MRSLHIVSYFGITVITLPFEFITTFTSKVSCMNVSGRFPGIAFDEDIASSITLGGIFLWSTYLVQYS